MNYHIKDAALAEEGKNLITWANRDMPVLNLIKKRFKKEQTLKGVRLAACLHITSETANLAITLKEGGAEVFLCASNPLSTNDAVAAALVKHYGIATFAIKGEDNDTYYKHLEAVLDEHPNQTMDDGADLMSLLHSTRKKQIKDLVGSTEETTTGVIRLRALAAEKKLKVPVVAVNDNLTKHMFDNRYGTGQSTVDAIMRSTNILLAGSKVVVCGYGWCGRGIAMRARGLGARVIVCEIEPVKALEALMDGYDVMPLKDAVKDADVILSATGNKHVIDIHHIMAAKDGAIIAQSGHFDVEINKKAMEKVAKTIRKIKPMVDEYIIEGKKIYLLGEGRLVNLAAADGHPSSVMDMSFAGQALAAEYIWKHKGKLENKVYSLPPEIDSEIAAMKLASRGIEIDKLSQEQIKYLNSWEEGT
ncbi:MAG: adenosylhomocysteinase [Patescibacteria group bacterium]|nr:adenosylhomocysteinase [Patescibacteria group bacterium]